MQSGAAGSLQVQGHKEGLQRKVTERQADARSKQAKLDQAHADNEAMRARIASQTVSRDDVIRMNHERCARCTLTRMLIPQVTCNSRTRTLCFSVAPQNRRHQASQWGTCTPESSPKQ